MKNELAKALEAASKESTARAKANVAIGAAKLSVNMARHVPDGFRSYCIPLDVSDDRRRLLQAQLEERGYFQDPTGEVIYPNIAGGEVWLISEEGGAINEADRAARCKAELDSLSATPKTKEERLKADILAAIQGGQPMERVRAS